MDPATISALITAAGAIGSSALDYFGRPTNANSQLNTLRPSQTGLQDSLIDLVRKKLSGQGGLTPGSQNALNRFNTQTVPGLAERFTSMGSGGSQGSSAFTGALSQAGSDLQNQLAESDFDFILRLLGPALGLSSENIHQEPSNFFSNAFGNIDQKSISDLVKAYQGNNGSAGNGTQFKKPELPQFGSLTQDAANNALAQTNYNRLGGSPF